MSFQRCCAVDMFVSEYSCRVFVNMMARLVWLCLNCVTMQLCKVAMLNWIIPPRLYTQSEGIITSYHPTTNRIKPYMLYSMALLGYQNDPHLMIPRWQTSADCTEVFLWFATHLSLWRFRSFTSTSAEWVGSCWISVIQDGWSKAVQDLSIWFILPPPGSVHAYQNRTFIKWHH